MPVFRGMAAVLFLWTILAWPTAVRAVDDWFASGLAALRAGQYQDALTAFNKAIDENPIHANAFNGRGAAWHSLGSYEQAIADYTRAIEINPEYANAYNNRGVAWHQKGEYEKAVEDYDRALSLHPNYVNALSNRGASRKKLQDYGAAIADFERALAIRPTFEAYNLLAWTLATCPDETFRDGPRAVELAQEAVSMHADARSLGTLAAAYAEAGRLDEAIGTQQRVVAMLPLSASEELVAEHKARLEIFRSRKAEPQDSAATAAPEPPSAEPAVAAPSDAPPPPAQPAEAAESASGKAPVTPPAEPAAAESSATAAAPTAVPEVVESASGKTPEPPPAKPAVAAPPAQKPATAEPLPFTIQISSFRDPNTAFQVGRKYREKGDAVLISQIHIPSKGGDWYRLFMGVFPTYDDAAAGAEVLKQRKFRHTRVSKKPLSIQVLPAGAGVSPDDLEQELLDKNHLPFRRPAAVAGAPDLLLIGAFESEAAAAGHMERLRADGFIVRLVGR